jgi:crotonobetainyl-CoA:carnitine CoA-transferase CaiB-like acyl-CoA transferase
MEAQNVLDGMLSPYRVLDLTDEKGLLCGKLLGDLGADVIKIESPGGDPARDIGPFYHDETDREKSLFWFAFNTSKRGITLDIETADGQRIFKDLVKSADFVIESFPPGNMESLGLGYAALEEINPRIIMISISCFGQTGPYKDYKAPDIVAWAMGGQMYPWGSADRPPVRISHHSQAHLHASGQAAAGAMMALYHLNMTGEGQHVDVSIQESVVRVTYQITAAWDMMKIIQQRGETPLPHINMRRVWSCKDGYIIWFFFGGVRARRFNLPLVQWMESEDMADDYLKEFNWDSLDYSTVTQDVIDRLQEPTSKFFMTHTKAELLEGALKRRIILYPMATSADIRESIQLAAREFWVEVEHPLLGTSITYPGPFAKASETPPMVSCRAPLIGEHNQEVFEASGMIDKQRSFLRKDISFADEVQGKERRQISGNKALKGLKVVDFTWAIAGPLATKTLADYGAEVIKIEGNSKPDPHRTAPHYKDDIPGVNRRGQFNQDSTGKLSVALNLSLDKGVEIAKEFVSWADIVVENFAGGAMDRMGLGYDELKKVKPDIIMISSCMQGQTGPFADHPGFGFHLAALSGFYQITGWPDREPPYLGPYTDFIAPHFILLTALAALDFRRRTGKGQYIEMSQYENGVHFLAPLLLDYVVNKRVAERMGNRNPHAAPHNAYLCRGEDRWCAIAVFTDDEWKRFCRVIGNPAWTKDIRFATMKARKENEESLDGHIEEWTRHHTAEEVMHRMQRAGVSAGLLQSGQDLLEHDPQLKHRHFFWELDHPEIGNHYAPGPPFILSKALYELQRSPLLSEHNEYALKEILGMSDNEIADLVAEEIVEFP